MNAILLFNLLIVFKDLESSSPIEPGTPDPRTGFGRFCTLKQPISVEDAVQIVKNRIELPHVRLARARGPSMEKFVFLRLFIFL